MTFSASFALFDMRRDRGEHYDVKELYPKVFEEMKKLADKTRDDLGDELLNIEGKNRREPGRVSNNE